MVKSRAVRPTARDMAALRWIFEMRVTYQADLAVLLGRLAGREPLGAVTTRDVVRRWERGQLVTARKVLADKSRMVWLTENGARLVGWENGTWHEPTGWSAWHTAEVAHVRLWLEGDPYFRQNTVGWVTETQLRDEVLARTGGKFEKGSRPHVPDGALVTADGQRWAVEVERTEKPQLRLQEIVLQLGSSYPYTVYAIAEGERLIRMHVEQAWATVQRQQETNEANKDKPKALRLNRLDVRTYPKELQA